MSNTPAMMPEPHTTEEGQVWPRCSHAAAFFEGRLWAFAAANPPVAAMAERFLNSAGVRLQSLVDHWLLPDMPEIREELTACGLTETRTSDGDPVWLHPQARLPRVRLSSDCELPRLTLATEEMDRFLSINGLGVLETAGDRDSGYEEAVYPMAFGDLGMVVRLGYDGFRPQTLSAQAAKKIDWARTTFQTRDRSGGDAATLARAQCLVESVISEIGPDRATDAFFAAEREYYMEANAAARWQYARQQALGFGWANHDHHTYRSSRPAFRALTRLWHTLGFVDRERFYAGAEAGWGAQIFEHPVSRVVIFADVDMAPDELNVDYASADLPPRDSLATIGLWCALHGSSIADAGMHHLEAEFDYARAREQFEAAGIGVMAPFTDLPFLKQAFTKAELWPVAPERIAALQEQGLITPEQAEGFRTGGAAGSHLEILQRWDGFKGFNKTGVSAIIKETDARRQQHVSLSNPS